MNKLVILLLLMTFAFSTAQGRDLYVCKGTKTYEPTQVGTLIEPQKLGSYPKESEEIVFRAQIPKIGEALNKKPPGFVVFNEEFDNNGFYSAESVKEEPIEDAHRIYLSHILFNPLTNNIIRKDEIGIVYHDNSSMAGVVSRSKSVTLGECRPF